MIPEKLFVTSLVSPDADTACKQWDTRTLAISWNLNAFYGQDNETIHLDNANCLSGKNNPDLLFFCGILTFHDCSYVEGVGISCPTMCKFQYTYTMW